MPATYIYVFKWFKVSKKTRKTSEVCKKPVLQNKTGGCLKPSGQSTKIINPNSYVILTLTVGGWSGGAMVLGKLPVPGRPTYLE